MHSFQYNASYNKQKSSPHQKKESSRIFLPDTKVATNNLAYPVIIQGDLGGGGGGAHK